MRTYRTGHFCGGIYADLKQNFQLLPPFARHFAHIAAVFVGLAEPPTTYAQSDKAAS